MGGVGLGVGSVSLLGIFILSIIHLLLVIALMLSVPIFNPLDYSLDLQSTLARYNLYSMPLASIIYPFIYALGVYLGVYCTDGYFISFGFNHLQANSSPCLALHLNIYHLIGLLIRPGDHIVDYYHRHRLLFALCHLLIFRFCYAGSRYQLKGGCFLNLVGCQV